MKRLAHCAFIALCSVLSASAVMQPDAIGYYLESKYALDTGHVMPPPAGTFILVQ